MKRVVVRYRVKPEFAARNVQLVQDVYAELHESKPAGLRYATFRLDDGVSFLHLAENDMPDGSNALDGVAAFRRFVEGIADRCDEQPVVTEIDVIGSYRFGVEVAP